MLTTHPEKSMSWMWKYVIAALLLTPAFSHAATIAELQAQVQTLLSQLAELQAQPRTAAAPRSGAALSASCPNLTRNLSRGSRGTDVAQLQQFLITQKLLTSDSATGYFGHDDASKRMTVLFFWMA